ncbi:uncharacterized protein LOC110831801 isoform X2 [Zootermopsis nevadensis]|uniref:uncharacterized protein LOC110831801 isoform X2 n=1 Tax=Zootermopsis nevadensis TaxID=136037 RepID=UPI000B8EE02F|nr:uncharacterized protein LOC110831801 isoform X2 [Zootermopsis nevadensis]
MHVVNSTVDLIVGNLADWQRYRNSRLLPVYNSLQHLDTGEQFFVFTEWEAWGPCVACNRIQGERRRLGRCRLKPNREMSSVHDIGPEAEKQHLINNVYELSCRSKLLAKVFPNISAVTSMVPEFIHAEACMGNCTKDAESQRFKGKQLHYKRQYTVAEGSNLTLVCPKATPKDVVTWLKNGAVVTSGSAEDEPHVAVHKFNILNVTNVTQAESGNYTCFVGEIHVLDVTVNVVPRTKLYTQGLQHYMPHLAFIILLCFTSYCVGLIVAWIQRRRFVGYQNIPNDIN